jgi:hypothetical protein
MMLYAQFVDFLQPETEFQSNNARTGSTLPPRVESHFRPSRRLVNYAQQQDHAEGE